MQPRPADLQPQQHLQLRLLGRRALAPGQHAARRHREAAARAGGRALVGGAAVQLALVRLAGAAAVAAAEHHVEALIWGGLSFVGCWFGGG